MKSQKRKANVSKTGRLFTLLTAMLAAAVAPVGRTRQREPRPCLQCGTLTAHAKAFCSAQHKRDWDAVNPGNGRYTRNVWSNLSVIEADGSKTFVRTHGEHVVSYNSKHPSHVKLRSYEQPKEVGLFDAVIDAMRFVERGAV